MPYRGHVENGVIVADDPVSLPDGTVVEFRPLKALNARHHPDVERFAGIIPPDVDVEKEYYECLRKKHQ